MKYIALLRGINVGGTRKVEMQRLQKLFKSLGCTSVETYLNSGNVMFASHKKQKALQLEVPQALEEEFGFKIHTLVKSKKEIQMIADAIPKEWENNAKQKTDIAYLFPEIDSASIIDTLPVKHQFIDIRYVKGAIIWNVKRNEYHKSHLNNIIRLKLYQHMTVRNVNTARFLAGDAHTHTQSP